MVVGPIWAAFCTASVFVWRAITTDHGTPGTVWGDYTGSALPALALFFACWTAANIGFAIASCAESYHRDRPRLFAAALIVMFALGLGSAAGLLLLPAQPTAAALLVTGISCPLSLAALAGTRSWSKARVASWDEADRETPCRDVPPFDLLREDETLLLHFKSERTPEPQLLIATNQRFVRASILGSDRTFVLEQSSPGQLTAASSQRVGHDLMTTAHFHDRRVMSVVGGDPVQSRNFAEAVNRLLRTGQPRH